MGMDIYGFNGNYFRANIWQWPVICHIMERQDYDVPTDWRVNEGAGLGCQIECDKLAELIDAFLTDWDSDRLVMQSSVFVNEEGLFVNKDTPGAISAYQVCREHVEEFVTFLRECGGFEIC